MFHGLRTSLTSMRVDVGVWVEAFTEVCVGADVSVWVRAFTEDVWMLMLMSGKSDVKLWAALH